MARMLGREEYYVPPEKLEELGVKLVEAAQTCVIAEVEQALNEGAAPDYRDYSHFLWSASHWACRHNSVDMLRILYSAGANFELKDRPDEWRPIHVAAKFGCLEAIQYLVGKDADLHATTRKGMTALIFWTC